MQKVTTVLFALLRSALRGGRLREEEKSLYTDEMLPALVKMAKKHDIAHLLALGLDRNGLLAEGGKNEIIKAVYRYEQMNYEYECLCSALEEAKIPFIPLKGSILRAYYPEPWMRTSCDIDVLVHREDLESALAYLRENLQYVEGERATHDVGLFSPQGTHVELHFDLVEEGRANRANDVLKSVWDNVSLKANCAYFYQMSDAFFYFYHIAHMAKHFEEGGCGIRPFLDLWILDNLDGAIRIERDALLEAGGLLKFAKAARQISRAWLDGEPLNEVAVKAQDFVLSGGVYGTSKNRVALKQKKKGGKIGYIFSRIFIPFSKLKRYYPILEKHPWLMPVMQVRRWFMLLRPDVARMAKHELSANKEVDKATAEELHSMLQDIGLTE